MSCRFAGCPTPSAFWGAVMARRCCLTPLGPDAELPLGQRNVFERPYPVRMGQLGPLFACVPSMQNFPRQVNAGENQDLYFATQLAFDALADAGIRPHSPTPVKGSVRVGYAPPFNASTVNWLQHTAFLDQTMDIIRRFFPHAPEESLGVVKEKLVESLPAPNASSFLLGTGYRFASWIARECSFSGVATTMDAGLLTGAATLQDAIADLSDIRSGAEAGATAVQPADLATVATTGEYSDLLNKPTIVSPVNADWDASSGLAEILHKPDLSIYAESADLATVATSGDYDDLLNKPVIPAAQVQTDWDAPSGMGQLLNKPDLSVYAQSSSLSTVATTGNYSDLNGITLPGHKADKSILTEGDLTLGGCGTVSNYLTCRFSVDGFRYHAGIVCFSPPQKLRFADNRIIFG